MHTASLEYFLFSALLKITEISSLWTIASSCISLLTCLVYKDYNWFVHLLIGWPPESSSHRFTDSMERNNSWEAACCVDTQAFPNILWNPKVHYRVRKSPAPVELAFVTIFKNTVLNRILYATELD
jgi:hypothetical protein